jgi:uncharacterized metal-binding protein YceD (DUF177 family)
MADTLELMPKQTEIHDLPVVHGFVRPVVVSKVGEAGLKIDVSATAAEKPKIAAYLDLLSLQALTAEVHVRRWRKGVMVSGHFAADVTQACVVTLDPVEGHVEGDFERRFEPDAPATAAKEVYVEPEGDDPAEPLGREIDLGEILLEELSLGLDPYPRKAGVEFAGEQDTVAKADHPFAVLSKLQGKGAKKKGKS